MLSRKALLIPAVASVGLLALLGLTGWGGSDNAAPSPSSSSAPHTTTQAVSVVPTVEAIVVKTTTTTPPPPPVTTTTSEAPPPEVTVPTVPPPASTETPDRGLIVTEGAPCRTEGAIAVSPRGKPLVCRENNNRKLRWEEA